MSANLDLVRSLFADWERGDFSSAEWADPEIDFVTIGAPEGEEYQEHGIPGMARGMRRFLTAWEGYRTEPEEYRELDNARILVLTRDTARGRTSGVDMVQARAYVLQLQRGKVTRFTSYWDRDRALADLGLEEQATAEESTTPDPVELRRGLLEAWNRRDFDAAQSFFAPDAVWETVGLGTTFEGVAAIRGFWQDWWAGYEELWVELEEPLDLGNGVTFGVVVTKGRPVGSSGYVRHKNAFVTVWVRGLVVRVTNYPDIDEARAAAERLAEQRAQADV